MTLKQRAFQHEINKAKVTLNEFQKDLVKSATIHVNSQGYYLDFINRIAYHPESSEIETSQVVIQYRTKARLLGSFFTLEEFCRKENVSLFLPKSMDLTLDMTKISYGYGRTV